ncbi:MAG: DUF47 family protein, partial [Pyrobaculum sp.]
QSPIVQRLRRIFTSGLNEFRDKMSSHLELSHQSFQILMSLIERRDVGKSEVDEAVRKITALEREGDELVRDMVDEVAQGAVVPTITNVVLIFLDNVDNILDMVYFCAKEIKRGFHLWQKDYVYNIISNEVKEILNLSKTMLEYLQKMIKMKNEEELRHYARIIGTLEEEIDEIKENSLDKIYGLDLGAVEFNHLITLIYTADKIADNIQDAAYHLVTIVASV